MFSQDKPDGWKKYFCFICTPQMKLRTFYPVWTVRTPPSLALIDWHKEWEKGDRVLEAARSWDSAHGLTSQQALTSLCTARCVHADSLQPPQAPERPRSPHPPRTDHSDLCWCYDIWWKKERPDRKRALKSFFTRQRWIEKMRKLENEWLSSVRENMTRTRVIFCTEHDWLISADVEMQRP